MQRHELKGGRMEAGHAGGRWRWGAALQAGRHAQGSSEGLGRAGAVGAHSAAPHSPEALSACRAAICVSMGDEAGQRGLLVSGDVQQALSGGHQGRVVGGGACRGGQAGAGKCGRWVGGGQGAGSTEGTLHVPSRASHGGAVPKRQRAGRQERPGRQWGAPATLRRVAMSVAVVLR